MLDYKPLPQEELQVIKNNNTKLIFLCISLGLFSGILLTSMAINNSDYYMINETCQSLINNSSIEAYQYGLFYAINYTQSTGNILYITQEGMINETSIVEQCGHMQQLNQGTING